MRIATVTGGRHVRLTASQIDRAFALFPKHSIDLVRCGMASGVDTAIWNALGSRGRVDLRREAWPAPWRLPNGAIDRSAGLRRNAGMLDGDHSTTTTDAAIAIATQGERASLLVAFDGGNGTCDCIVAAIDRSIMIEPIDRDAGSDHPRRAD